MACQGSAEMQSFRSWYAALSTNHDAKVQGHRGLRLACSGRVQTTLIAAQKSDEPPKNGSRRTDGMNASALTSDDLARWLTGASAASTAFLHGATCTRAFMPASCRGPF